MPPGPVGGTLPTPARSWTSCSEQPHQAGHSSGGTGPPFASLTTALALGAGLLVVDLVAWKLVAAMFDRERLIVGSKA